MMFQAYLVFQSVTGGQRAKAALERYGLSCSLQRSPRQISKNGCAYALTVSDRGLHRAIQQLLQERITPMGVFLRRPDGSFEKVSE